MDALGEEPSQPLPASASLCMVLASLPPVTGHSASTFLPCVSVLSRVLVKTSVIRAELPPSQYHLNQLHMQRPHFQIRSQSEVLGGHEWVSDTLLPSIAAWYPSHLHTALGWPNAGPRWEGWIQPTEASVV